MKHLLLTTDKVVLLEEIIGFWIEDYETTGTKHSMMKEAKALLKEVKGLSKPRSLWQQMQDKLVNILVEYVEESEHQGIDVPDSLAETAKDYAEYVEAIKDVADDEDPNEGPAMGNPSDHGG